MSDKKNTYAQHFNEAITMIRGLPASERSAISNRQAAPSLVPRPQSDQPTPKPES